MFFRANRGHFQYQHTELSARKSAYRQSCTLHASCTLSDKKMSSSSSCWYIIIITTEPTNHLHTVYCTFSRQNRVWCWQVVGQTWQCTARSTLAFLLGTSQTMHYSPQSTGMVTRAGSSRQMIKRCRRLGLTTWEAGRHWHCDRHWTWHCWCGHDYTQYMMQTMLVESIYCVVQQLFIMNEMSHT